jgi:tetratricopeptide (TPR) repeat protein
MRRIGKKQVLLVAVLLIAGSVICANRVANSRRLDRILAEANRALEQRDFRLASSRLGEYLDSRPDDLPVRLLAAQTARRQGDFAAARNHLRRYQEHKGSSELRLREERLLIAQEDGTSDGEDLIASCLSPSPPEDVEMVLEVVIEQQLKVLERAHSYRQTVVEGPYAKSRAQTEQAIGIWLQRRSGQPDQIQGLIWRGRLSRLTDPRAAVDDFRRATDIDPDHILARLNLAISLIEYDAHEAGQHLEYLHARIPQEQQGFLQTQDSQNQHVMLLLAQVRRSLGQFEGAIDILDQLLQRNPNHTPALLERGKATLDAGRPNEAEQFLRLALAQTPNDPFVHLALSRCLLLNGKESEAKHHEERHKTLQLEQLKSEEVRLKSRRERQDKIDRGATIPQPDNPRPH